MLPIICIALVLRLGHATGGARVLCTDMLRLRKADKKVWLWLLQRYKIVVTHTPKENMLLIYQLAQAHWSTFWWILYGHYAANSQPYYYKSITPSLLHSWLKTFLFCKSFTPQPFLFFFRTDYMDSPDCLLLLLSISISYFLAFLFLHFLVVGSMQ